MKRLQIFLTYPVGVRALRGSYPGTFMDLFEDLSPGRQGTKGLVVCRLGDAGRRFAGHNCCSVGTLNGLVDLYKLLGSICYVRNWEAGRELINVVGLPFPRLFFARPFLVSLYLFHTYVV